MQDILESREVMFAVAMANPKFRGAVKSQAIDMNWDSPMAASIAEFFLHPEMDGQPLMLRALQTHLSETLIPSEIVKVLDACMGVVKEYREDSNNTYTNSMIRQFISLYKSKRVQRIIKEADYDPEKIIRGIAPLRDLGNATIPIWNMAELDADKVHDEDLGTSSIIPSTFDFIRVTNYPYEGYQTGEVCMVCAAPGVGKTLYLCHEVVTMMEYNRELEEAFFAEHSDFDDMEEEDQENLLEELDKQRVKVWWLAAGDMMRWDFICRLSAIYHGVSIGEVKLHYNKYFTDDVKNLLKYLYISVIPASYIDAHGVKHYVETQMPPGFEPNVVIIDYDANLITSKGENMYFAGEEVYNIATAIAKPIGKPGRLVFVASQPKVQYWDEPQVPKEGAAESSRKQAIIDTMITIGRNPNAVDCQAGIFYIAKSRRGKTGTKAFYKMEDGLFTVIDQNMYNSCLAFSSDNYSQKKKNKEWKEKGNYR